MQDLPKRTEFDVSITIEFDSERKCKSIVNALIPDNVKIPKGLLLQVSSSGKIANLRIKGMNNESAGSIVASTMDEMLEHISVANRVVES